jgi:hypothetical protein
LGVPALAKPLIATVSPSPDLRDRRGGIGDEAPEVVVPDPGEGS